MDKKVKTMISDQEVRDRILAGVEKVAKAVGTTLGSRGRNVAYELNWNAPNVLHDGVSVAKQVVLEDPYENMAAQLVIKAAERTNDIAGDGTTTATVLTYAIVKEAMPLITAGVNPNIVRKGIEKAVTKVITELQTMKKDVSQFEELMQVATISAADPEMGKIIATAIEKVGEEGVVTVQEGTGTTIEVEYKEGLEFERGLMSAYFSTESDSVEAILQADKADYPYVILVNEKVDNEKAISILEKIYDNEKSAKVLFIADDYDNDALNTILFNFVRGNKKIIPVKSPEFGDHRTALLNDIAVVTGGEVLGGAAGLKIEQATLESFGRCDKAIVTLDQTIIIGGKGDKKKVDGQIKIIRKLHQEAKTDSERDKAEKRIGKLKGGVAVISVGAHSETEMREKKERVYDAQNATKAAISEGIVPGGGVALLRARRAIDTLVFADQTPTEGLLDGKKIDGREREKIGADIVKSALMYPIRKLIDNAGVENPDHIVGKIEENNDNMIGYNVDTEQFVNLYKEGIIDPLKVVRTALQQASSRAIMLLTTDVMIAFKREIAMEDQKKGDGIGRFFD